MSRILMVSLFIVSVVTPLSAQKMPERRFAIASSAFDTASVFVVQPFIQENKLRPAPVGGQLLSGLAGFAAGVGGTFALISISDWPQDLSAELPIMVGAIVGTTAGVHVYSYTQGWTSSVGSTLLGTTIGLLGGPVGMPIGATVFYNKSRRERKQP